MWLERQGQYIYSVKLDNLIERRNNSLQDLLAILSHEECPHALSYSYDELINTQPPDMAVSRAISRGEP